MPTNPSVIELSALDGSNGFQISGEAAGDHIGYSVAGAGDVNGDGFADLIIGAIGADPNGSNSGAAYVVFGKAGGFASTFQLSALNGADGFQVNGEATGDIFARAVASAGDVNGDGFADLIVGARRADPNGSYSGASYVVFGKAGGFASAIEASALDGADGFQVNGEATNDFSGTSVASAGDVNGDGFDDLIIGAKYADPNGSASGAAYVVFGKAGGFTSTIQLSALSGADGFQINGVAATDEVGVSVASAGDVNGDGFADLFIGAKYAHFKGASYVVFGKAGAFGATIELSTLDGLSGFRIDGKSTNDHSGFPVASAGDINGDGFADLIVGAYGADYNGSDSGASYVVFGKAGGFNFNFQLSTLNGADGFQINGEAAGDYSGFSVAGAGDVNGDGFDDLVIGAKGTILYNSSRGASYVVFGKAGGFDSTIELSALDGSDGFRIDGAAFGDRSGFSVAGAGDVNGDGFADLIVGAYGADSNGTNSGASYVIYGTRALIDVLRPGTEIANRINGGHGDDTVLGFSGNDTLIGWEGDDIVSGGSGRDNIRAGSGDDTLDGGAGNDDLAGQNGDDTLKGGSGNDRLDGGADFDRVIGGSGNDTILASSGHDTLSGGSGIDLLNVGAHFTGATVVDLAAGTARFAGGNGARLFDIENVTGTRAADNIGGDAGANRLTGAGGNDILAGAGGNDTLTGDNGNDVVGGGGGKDRLFGNAGADTLSGGGGNDTLAGGTGRDILNGGAGADHFIFTTLKHSAPGAHRDHIADFSKLADLIDVSGIDAKAGVGGNRPFTSSPAPSAVTRGSCTPSTRERTASLPASRRRQAPRLLDPVEGLHNLHMVDFVL